MNQLQHNVDADSLSRSKRGSTCRICFTGYMTVSQVADILGLSRTTVWRMVRDGEFKTARRVGRGRGYFSIDALEVSMLRAGERMRSA